MSNEEKTLDKNDEAREYILSNIGSSHLYQEYVNKRLAGDFACVFSDALKHQAKRIEELEGALKFVVKEMKLYDYPYHEMNTAQRGTIINHAQHALKL